MVTPNKATPNKAIFALFAPKSENFCVILSFFSYTVVTPNKANPNKAIFALFVLKSENMQIRQCLI